MVGVTKIQRGNAGYWLAAVAEGGEDYYTKPGEAPGEWVGELAEEMGLFGTLDAAAYTAILEGRDPRDGTPLVARPAIHHRELADGSEKRVEPVLGYDVRFSAPKSVSILYALGDAQTRKRVISILNDAVRQGIAHLEREACFVQRGRGGSEIEPGCGFVGMAFRHRMSRAGDPALHVHVVVSNLTRAESDGKWLSLASPRERSPLWPHGKSAGVIFQAALRAGFMREFGLAFEEVTNGYADLRGFGRELIEALSTRSAEIGELLETYGLESAKAAQVAAYRTRAEKDYGIAEDNRRAEWEATAEPYGVTPKSLAEMVERATPREPRALAAEHVDAALAQLEQTCSHFDRRGLFWALCDQLPEGADLDGLTHAVDAVIESERVICLYSSADPLDPDHYTTPRILEQEHRFIECARGGADAGAAQVSRAEAEAVLGDHAYLGADQREMVLRLACGGERVIAVAAWPGTGKTAALGAATEAWERAGFPVIGCATARTASAELKAVGIPSTSIRKLQILAERLRAEGKAPLAPGTVILADEASMISTPDLDSLRFLALECGGKLVAIGDPHQIGAIGPGGLFAHFTRQVEPVRLTEIRRQHRHSDRRLIALVHERRGSEALDLLRSEGKMIVGEALRSTLEGMLADWHRDFATGADAVMVARRNRHVSYLNEHARELRRELGELGQSEVLVGEHAFAAGDRVQTRINREGALNRERWEVLEADAAARTLTLRRLGGEEGTLTLGPRYLDRTREDGGPALEHAYALTIYGAQGKTVDRVFPLLDGDASLEVDLVALSRAREVTHVYAVAANELLDPDLGPARREIAEQLQDVRSSVEHEKSDFAAAEVAARVKIAQMPGYELAARRAKLMTLAREADPLHETRERLDRRIAEATVRLERLRSEHEALESMPSQPAEALRRVRAAGRGTAKRLARDRAERDALPELDRDGDLKRLDRGLRLEAILIERRIDQLARRDVRAERLEPSEPFYTALGAYPVADPAKAHAWQEGMHAAATYRRRYGVSDESSLLGGKPRDLLAQSEQERAQRLIERAQRQLDHSAELSMQQQAERSLEAGR